MLQENRVQSLKKEVDHSIKMAELIEYNLEDVDAAILAVRVALANGMNWEDLARMVKEEKKSGNPVAGLIDKLYLERNCMTLLLSNNLDEMDDDEKTFPVDKVWHDAIFSPSYCVIITKLLTLIPSEDMHVNSKSPLSLSCCFWQMLISTLFTPA